jgi:hypothetical protein
VTKADTRKHHFIYKTTRTTDGRYYIGMHSTDDMNDGYLGSGVHLRRSVNRHGREAHTREILEILPTRAALVARERELVDEAVVADPLSFNMIVGGSDGPRNEGKPRSAESRARSRDSMLGRLAGERNPNYGMVWITNGRVTRKIKRGSSLPRGFRLGRSHAGCGQYQRPQRYVAVSPDGRVFVGTQAVICAEHKLSVTFMRKWIDRGPVPEHAVRSQTRNCVGWSLHKT